MRRLVRAERGSGIGTFETCRPMRPMSVHRVRPEVFVVPLNRRVYPKLTLLSR
jgi:hypothetical protein